MKIRSVFLPLVLLATSAGASPEAAPCPLCVSDFEKSASPAQPASPYSIKVPDRGEFSLNNLIDHNGNVIDDAYAGENFANKNLLIYFGFPDCKWFCPPSAQAIREASSKFPKDQMTILVIASRTDPNTKKPYTSERMKEFSRAFGEGQKVIALTGSVEDLGRIYRALNVNDKNGNHVPYVGLVNPEAEFLGGVLAVRENSVKGQPPIAAPDLVRAGIGRFLMREPVPPSTAPQP